MLQLLATLPFIQFVFIYLASAKKKQLHIMKQNYAIMYLDWIFVPFNLLIPAAITFSYQIFLVSFAICLVASILLNYAWARIKHPPQETQYFVRKEGLSYEGFIHLIFMIIQGALILTMFFSNPISSYFMIIMLLLLVYLISYILIILLVRKVRLRSKTEFPLIILGIIAIIVRLIVNLI